MQSKAATVDQYLAELPEDRRAAIQTVREFMLKNLDKKYEEGMQYGMIGYYVPHSLYPAGYHCDPKQPLPFAGLASQKNHMALYLMCIYGSNGNLKAFQDAWKKTGKKLDMGKSCIRFSTVDDLALDVLGDAIRKMPVKRWVEFYEKALKSRVPTPRKELAVKAAAKAKATTPTKPAKRNARAGKKSKS